MSLIRGIIRRAERFLKLAGNFEQRSPEFLHSFSESSSLDNWRSWSDSAFGGFSQAQLQHDEIEGTAKFFGTYSTKLPTPTEGSPKLSRSGFAGISTKITGQWTDLAGFDTLVYRVKTDGRVYLANLRTDNWLLGGPSEDVWQAVLRTRASSQWEEVEIPIDSFILTHRGKVVPGRQEMHTGRVISMGIAIAAAGEKLQPEGPFCLELAWIKAKNRGAPVQG
uniref:NADH dehydrogenase [ubiquinone] 1 alpha subcomplex assembly factor 1 n=2 Tax=Tetraselmis sp. GSL018 TaxID=582737 RepID=A0A061RXC8_9CHLO|mmetsp:Transcript_36929/g.87748  ORF Transcript_36929/g.87748 Transcript_36929/m.87748 type:complete len:222 (-) Transcript_36929:452-1117(-)